MSSRKIRPHVADVLGPEWRTPQTYCNRYATLGDFPAVYALVVFPTWETYKIVYVGMSKRIGRRFHVHHAVREIQKKYEYYQVWFRHTDVDCLREAERDLIQKYDPPLNIIGKRAEL